MSLKKYLEPHSLKAYSRDGNDEWGVEYELNGSKQQLNIDKVDR